MKKFILYIIISLSIYLVLLECTTRVLDLSGHTIPEANLNNNRLGRPNSEGIWVKGGMREISSHYKMNPQGFNSLKDYSNIDKNKVSIAIIGDSYVEGFHVDVENSIGRILEAETENSVEVHEYGKSGGNIVDYSQIFDKFIRNRYDYTFILVTNKDITSNEAFFMGKGSTTPKNSVIREIYNRVSFIRYLNINHRLNAKLNKIFSFSGITDRKQKYVTKNDVNVFALKVFNNTCTILCEQEKLDTHLIKSFVQLPCIEIIHQITPYKHGFDSHWNFNGRKNCALTIKNYIEETRITNEARTHNRTGD
ncbi:MAG: hypothetical protein JEZ14_23190 [Marinilabiliaceae bacterium]|nr:hypothetical protein [Marinilabiliaceae bacterium]